MSDDKVIEISSSATLEEFAREVVAWQRGIFPDATAQSIAYHLYEEALELRRAPGDPMEMADVLMLLFAAAAWSEVDLLQAAKTKFAINQGRTFAKAEGAPYAKHVTVGGLSADDLHVKTFVADDRNVMLSPMDIIAGFEKRIAEVVWTNQRLHERLKEEEGKRRLAQKQFEDRPFKELKELPTKELLKELDRRLDYYDSYKDRDDD